MIGLVLKENVLSTIIHGYFVCPVQIKLLCTLLDAFIGISAMRLCVCFFKKMGSPNTSNVSALLGE